MVYKNQCVYKIENITGFCLYLLQLLSTSFYINFISMGLGMEILNCIIQDCINKASRIQWPDAHVQCFSHLVHQIFIKLSVIYRASRIQWPDGQSVMFTLRPPNNY